MKIRKTLKVDEIDFCAQEFWELPLEEREGAFATLRSERPIPFMEEPELPVEGFPRGPGYWSLTRHADLQEASRNPEIFSSAQGATSIFDLPQEFSEFCDHRRISHVELAQGANLMVCEMSTRLGVSYFARATSKVDSGQRCGYQFKVRHSLVYIILIRQSNISIIKIYSPEHVSPQQGGAGRRDGWIISHRRPVRDIRVHGSPR